MGSIERLWRRFVWPRADWRGAFASLGVSILQAERADGKASRSSCAHGARNGCDPHRGMDHAPPPHRRNLLWTPEHNTVRLFLRELPHVRGARGNLVGRRPALHGRLPTVALCYLVPLRSLGRLTPRQRAERLVPVLEPGYKLRLMPVSGRGKVQDIRPKWPVASVRTITRMPFDVSGARIFFATCTAVASLLKP